MKKPSIAQLRALGRAARDWTQMPPVHGATLRALRRAGFIITRTIYRQVHEFGTGETAARTYELTPLHQWRITDSGMTAYAAWRD